MAEQLLKSMSSLAIDPDSANTHAPDTPDLIRECKLNYRADACAAGDNSRLRHGPMLQLNANPESTFRFRNILKESNLTDAPQSSGARGSTQNVNHESACLDLRKCQNLEDAENEKENLKWIKIKPRSPSRNAKCLVPMAGIGGIQKKSPLPKVLRPSPGAKRCVPGSKRCTPESKRSNSNNRANPRQRPPTTPKLKTPLNSERRSETSHRLLDVENTPYWWLGNEGVAHSKIPSSSLRKLEDSCFDIASLEDQINSIANLKSDISKSKAVQELRLSELSDEDFRPAISALSDAIPRFYFQHEIEARKAKFERREVQERLCRPRRASVPATPAKKEY